MSAITRMRGFTLIELLLVIVIAGILMTLAGPAMYEMILANRMTGQTNDLIADLAYARAQATSLGTRISVCVSPGGTSCVGSSWSSGRIAFADTDASGTYDTGETLLRVTGAMSSDTVVTPAGLTTSTLIQFRPTGIPAGLSAASATFKLCDSRTGADVGRTVTVALTGRISASKSACP